MKASLKLLFITIIKTTIKIIGIIIVITMHAKKRLLNSVCFELQKTILRVSLQQNISSLLDHPLCEGIPVLQHSRTYPCPSENDNSRCEGFIFGNILWHCVYKIYCLFRCCGRFSRTEIYAYSWEFLNWSTNESKPLSFYDQSREGGVLEVSLGRERR